MKFLILTILILFTQLPNPGNCSHLQCFVLGECTNSQDVDIVSSKDEFQCLDICHQNANCTWFSFLPDSQVCHLLSNCESIEDTFCKNCVSGERQCDNPAPICFVLGIINLFNYEIFPASVCLSFSFFSLSQRDKERERQELTNSFK